MTQRLVWYGAALVVAVVAIWASLAAFGWYVIAWTCETLLRVLGLI